MRTESETTASEERKRRAGAVPKRGTRFHRRAGSSPRRGARARPARRGSPCRIHRRGGTRTPRAASLRRTTSRYRTSPVETRFRDLEHPGLVADLERLAGGLEEQDEEESRASARAARPARLKRVPRGKAGTGARGSGGKRARGSTRERGPSGGSRETGGKKPKRSTVRFASPARAMAPSTTGRRILVTPPSPFHVMPGVSVIWT